MKALLILILSAVAAYSADRYLIIGSGGLVENIVLADSDFSPAGKTKVLASQFPAANAGDSVIDGVLVPRVINHTPTSEELIAAAQAIYDAQELDDQAVFLPVYVAVRDALQRGQFALAKRTIELADVPEGQLQTVRGQLLSLFPTE